MIEVHDLSKRFGRVRALENVSFSCPDGKITGLLGPNGAGKSTALRILYTVIRADSGTASVDKLDVQKDSLRVREKIGVLSDGAGLYPNLSARENVEYFGRLHGLRGRDLVARVDELVDVLGMSEFADRRAKGFSHGQRTRVALARALVHRPPNLLLDEPSNGLDVMATRSLRDMLRRVRAMGVCVLFSSHVMQEVAALCDEIVIIDKGHVAACGSPDGLRAASGKDSLEDAFVSVLGSGDGLA
ncbi:MAG: ATP-binding cassette domain-containing protein [Gammaproteobacteria bacterium]|nr:MAG: ATP-binding cassette domain-containing protein [Gammaproteobacteria bacterium]